MFSFFIYLYLRVYFMYSSKEQMVNAQMENETHKFLLDFDIQTDPPISARRPDLAIINKKKKRELAKL